MFDLAELARWDRALERLDAGYSDSEARRPAMNPLRSTPRGELAEAAP